MFITKIVAYYLTHSLAILSDALESIVNVIAGFVGLYSLFVAAKPSDADHPYGHGKAEFVSAAIEGGLIMSAGILILFETIRNFINPVKITELQSGILLIAATGLINYVAGVTCVRIGRKNKSLALLATGKHLQVDTYSTIVVIAGLLLVLYVKLLWLDKVLALALSGFIMYTGYKIIRQSLAGIMDEQDMELLQLLVDKLNKNRQVNWIDLHNLRVIKYGSHLHVDCHLTVPWYLNVDEAHIEIDSLIKLIEPEFGSSIEFFVHTDGCKPFSCRICNKEDCPVRQHPFEHTVEWTIDNLLLNRKHRIDTRSI